jgi:exopolysaccharide biosynthesis polyprenyl glycosylphosphotransferase
VKSSNRLRLILLVVGDVIIFYFSLLVSLTVRFAQLPDAQTWLAHMGPFSYVFPVWLVIFSVAGLYRLDIARDSMANTVRIGASVAIAVLCTVAMFYIFRDLGNRPKRITPKTILAIQAVVFTALSSTWRYLFDRFLRRRLPKTRVGFIGNNEIISELIAEIRLQSHKGYSVAFIYDTSPGAHDRTDGIAVCRDRGSLASLVRGNSADLLTISDDQYKTDGIQEALFDLLPNGVVFKRLADFYELIMQRVPLNTITHAWFLEKIDLPGKGAYEIIKRGADIVFAILFLLVTLPFWPFIMAAIAIESPGPVFFTQQRLGRLSTKFRIIKFRTMTTNGDTDSPTTENDKRVTAVGEFLRRTRIDELPQMLNILRGDMSFIGPRPERPALVEMLEKKIPYYRQRMLVKPGVTGWDQVCGEYHSPSVDDTFKKLQYDLFYVKNESVFLDISIAVRTVMTVLSRKGR